MPPVPGREYTVSCSLKRAVLDQDHLVRIKDVVTRVGLATIHATELLNLYVRDRIENQDATGLDSVFKQNWLLNAYYAVTSSDSKRQPSVDPSVRQVFFQHMAGSIADLPSRKGLSQALGYECINLAAVASSNVWMHFRKRVLSHVRTRLAISEDAFKALSKQQRRERRLALFQVAEDLYRNPGDAMRSPEEYRAFVTEERARLGIDDAVGDWAGKPILYHLKARPHRFLRAMHTMSVARAAAGRSSFSLFPLRRSRVPAHMRFEQKVLDEVLGLGAAWERAKAKKAKADSGEAKATSGRAPKRKRDDPSLVEEKAALFGQIVDLRAAGVHRRSHFAFSFTTDGVSMHLNMEKPPRDSAARLAAMPSRGIHSIDALKQFARSENVHTVGIDPGKRELLVAVDRDDPEGGAVVRYTLDQRRRDMRTRQYMDEGRREKPIAVENAEQALSLLNSKAPLLSDFAAFAARRRALMRETPEWSQFYAREEHRERRRKTKIKAQASEARLVNRLKGMHAQGDERPLVLAYGAWGLVAGRAGAAANKGNPPAVGAGLMKKLSVEFLVVPTPEHYTSKTCVRCMGTCGAHPTLLTKNGKEIRGLRVCQHEGCGLLQNRDRTGATNIGLQFQRLLDDKSPIRDMSQEELEFHRLNTCLECCD